MRHKWNSRAFIGFGVGCALLLCLGVYALFHPSGLLPMVGEGGRTASAQETAGLWAEHRIIDIHAHIGTFQGFDLSTPNLIANIQRHGVRLALVSNIDGAALPGVTQNLNETQANEASAETVRQYPQ